MKLQRQYLDSDMQVVTEEVIDTTQETTIGKLFSDPFDTNDEARRIIIYREDGEAVVWTRIAEEGN